MSNENNSLKERIKAAAAAKVEAVTLSDGTIAYVREMSGRDRDAWEQGLVPAGDGKVDVDNVTARMLVYCIVDANGQRVFDDAAELGAFGATTLNMFARVARRLNKLTPEDMAAAEGN